LDRVSGYGPEG